MMGESIAPDHWTDTSADIARVWQKFWRKAMEERPEPRVRPVFDVATVEDGAYYGQTAEKVTLIGVVTDLDEGAEMFGIHAPDSCVSARLHCNVDLEERYLGYKAGSTFQMNMSEVRSITFVGYVGVFAESELGPASLQVKIEPCPNCGGEEFEGTVASDMESIVIVCADCGSTRQLGDDAVIG